MNVSPQQQQEALAGKPVHLRDPETNAEFVLLRARQAAGDEWNDPGLDVYEQYRKEP